MRATTYAAAAVAALILSAGACALSVSATNAAARLLARCNCEQEALAARLTTDHCAARPAVATSTANGF